MDRSGTWKRISRNWGLYLLLLPALVLLILFAYKPMYGVVIAFKNYKNSLGILGSPWVDPLFKNFQRFFNSYQCGTTIRNTLRLSLYSLAVGFPIPIILALMINQITAMRVRRAFQTILYLPHFISTVVMVGLLLIWLSPSSGLVGAFYRLLGRPVLHRPHPLRGRHGGRRDPLAEDALHRPAAAHGHRLHYADPSGGQSDERGL